MDLNNTKVAYEHLSDAGLRRNRFVFRLIKNPRITTLLTKLAAGAINLKLPLKFLIRRTVFKVFCAGENNNEVLSKMKELKTQNVHSVLDYVAEGENSEESFNQNLDKILHNIQLCVDSGSEQFIGVKPSSLTDCEQLKLYAEQGIKFGEIENDRLVLDLIKKMTVICNYANKNNVYVYFDAEEYLTQGYFDNIVKGLMKQFNRERIVVFNTIQLYLKDRLLYLEELVKEFEMENIKLGLKLVRGAYLEQERKLASKQNRPSPVHDTKIDTDNAFNRALEICLKNHQTVYTCIATHNQESVEMAIRLIEENCIEEHYARVFFSQLYGMSDNLTYNLAKSNYNSSKYMPYGELKKAIPYLIRRAEENSSMNDQSHREYELLNSEYSRRKVQKS